MNNEYSYSAGVISDDGVYTNETSTNQPPSESEELTAFAETINELPESCNAFQKFETPTAPVERSVSLADAIEILRQSKDKLIELAHGNLVECAAVPYLLAYSGLTPTNANTVIKIACGPKGLDLIKFKSCWDLSTMDADIETKLARIEHLNSLSVEDPEFSNVVVMGGKLERIN